MKRFGAFLFAATVMASAALPTTAEAVEISASGQVITRFAHVENINLNDGSSGFYTGQAFSPYLKFTVSENLSATLNISASSDNIGYGSGTYSAGGYTGLFLKAVVAFADAKALDGDFTARFGMQSAASLSYTFGIEMLATGEMAGVRTSYKVSDDLGINVAWYRPYIQANSDPALFNIGEENAAIDVFQVHAPMAFANIDIIPTVQLAYTANQASVIPGTTKLLWTPSLYGGSTKPAGYNALSWFAGTSARVKISEDLSVSADAHYGSTSVDKLATSDKAGFLVGAAANYGMDFGSLNVLGWYGSGDDNNKANGSENMPQIAVGAGGFKPAQRLGGAWANDLHFSQDPNCYLPGGAVGTPVGTWGLGVGVSNMSFLDKLNHSLWTVYSAGTNDEANISASTTSNYLGTEDALWQIGFTNWYNVNRNLVLRAEAVYGVNMFDDKKRPTLNKNPMRISTSFVLLF